jgi:hypothetical protein
VPDVGIEVQTNRASSMIDTERRVVSQREPELLRLFARREPAEPSLTYLASSSIPFFRHRCSFACQRAIIVRSHRGERAFAAERRAKC